jgi:hypothetical protein
MKYYVRKDMIKSHGFFLFFIKNEPDAQAGPSVVVEP